MEETVSGDRYITLGPSGEQMHTEWTACLQKLRRTVGHGRLFKNWTAHKGHQKTGKILEEVEEAMTKQIQLKVIDRRDFVLGATAAAAVTALLTATPNRAWAGTFDDAIKKLIGDAKPTEGRVSLEMPEIAENGNTVPFGVSVESPMTDKDYVKTVHVFASKNPNPNVISFHFSPLSGKATATSRMRLASTQDVVAIAEMSDGKFFMGKRTVKVTIGGCGG